MNKSGKNKTNKTIFKINKMKQKQIAKKRKKEKANIKN